MMGAVSVLLEEEGSTRVRMCVVWCLYFWVRREELDVCISGRRGRSMVFVPYL